MSKRKSMDKTQARERRNQLLACAAAAELSLTEGVREMRAIAGMTQDEFARHREVSARVIKAIELGQGNPTVATLNRIGQFFGLEVGFVPIRKTTAIEAPSPTASPINLSDLDLVMEKASNDFMRLLSGVIADVQRGQRSAGKDLASKLTETTIASPEHPADNAPVRKKRQPRST